MDEFLHARKFETSIPSNSELTNNSFKEAAKKLSNSSYLVGKGSLLINCALFLREKGFEVKGIISQDPRIEKFALDKGFPYISTDKNDLNKELSNSPFEYLFDFGSGEHFSEGILKLPMKLAIQYVEGLLPKYTGVNTGFWSLYNREKEHGVSWQLQDRENGDREILSQKRILITTNETSGSLGVKTENAALESFKELIGNIISGTLSSTIVSINEKAVYSSMKRLPLCGVIDWKKSTAEIRSLFNALDYGDKFNPMGLPKVYLGNSFFIISRYRFLTESSMFPSGCILKITNKEIRISALSHTVVLEELKDLKGEIVPISTLVDKYRLHLSFIFPPIPTVLAAKLEKFDKITGQHQDYWAGKLSQFSPVELPFSSGNLNLEEEQLKEISIKLPYNFKSFTDRVYPGIKKTDILISACLAYLFKIGINNTVGVGLEDEALELELGEASNFFATILPLGLEVDPEFDFDNLLFNALHELSLINTHKSYSKDLVFRHPVLKDDSEKLKFRFILKKVVSIHKNVKYQPNAITIVVSEQDKCKFVYKPNMISDEDAEVFVKHLQILLQDILSEVKRPVKHFNLMFEPERNEILYKWNETEGKHPKDKLLSQLFEEQVRHNPQGIAVYNGEKALTYEQLNQRANQLAHYLKKNGLGMDAMVGVCLDRSEELIIAILAVLKGGGTYVPLDVNLPEERIYSIMEEVKASIVVTVDKWESKCSKKSVQLVVLDKEKDKIISEADSNLKSKSHPSDLACVLFTSGSTGTPKAVGLHHQGIVHLVKETNYAEYNSHIKILSLSPLSFDVSLCEVWGSLTNGGTLVMVSSNVLSVSEIKQLIRRNNISMLFITVTLFHLLIEEGIEDLHSLNQVLIGGDVISPAHLNKALLELPTCKFTNSYGPAENTCFSTFYTAKEAVPEELPVPIGKPVSNSLVYVLDKCLQPLPIGIPGEICVGGDGVARGYLNNEELSKEKFVKNPFVDSETAVLYKTGDIGKFLPDGNLEFIGRIDGQAKIRGFRIEIGEVEAALKKHNGISEAVVLVEGNHANDKRLIGFFVVKKNAKDISVEELNNHLRNILPDYMVPSILEKMDELPLTAHGKVDKKKLKLPEEPLPLPKVLPEEPAKEIQVETLEDSLTSIWKKVLKKETINNESDFFKNGGDSLLVVKLVSEIRFHKGFNLPVVSIFSYPTPVKLAKYINGEFKKKGWSSLVTVRENGNKKPVFLIHPITGEIDYVYRLAGYFDDSQPFYALQAVGLNGIDEPFRKIEEMASHYLKLILDKEPEGPYRLGGYVQGGLIAYEIALQLKKMGKEVSLLALFDTYPLKPDQMPLASVISSCKNFFLDGDISLSQKVKSFSSKLPKVIDHVLTVYPGKILGRSEDVEVTSTSEKIKFSILSATYSYKVQAYDGKVVFFRSLEGPVKYLKNFDYGWKKFALGGVDVHELPGNQISMFRESSNVKTVAEVLKGYLE